MAAKHFTDLLVWQRAHQFVLAVYQTTQEFPREELYGLSSQLRRAATSIAANIAEGFRKRGRADKVRFFNVAEGSLDECRYYLILAHDLGYSVSPTLSQAADDVARLLQAYSSAVRRDIS